MFSAQSRIQKIASHLVPSSSSSDLVSDTVSSGKCPVRGRLAASACPGKIEKSKAWALINTDPFKFHTASPLKVVITGAAGQIAYSLIFMVARGNVFGPHQPVIIYLLDIPKMLDSLQGVIMELQDCASPLLKGVVATADLKEAFSGAHVILMVGAFPRGPGMERKDLLEKNVSIFKEQGDAIEKYASRNVKVCVVGNPANTNCLALISQVKTIPHKNFSALTRLDHNRAQAQVALKVGTSVQNVHNVIIWGNHSNTQYPDLSQAYISNQGVITPVRTAINDDQWVKSTFIPTVQQRGAAVIKARKLSSAASAATAIVDHVRTWLLGTRQGEFVSMAVPSSGEYGVPEGLVFSYPVVCSEGDFTVVQGLNIDQFSKDMMAVTTKELVEERNMAFEFLAKK
eukprot:TRINITY_DN323_c0_g1_i3.p1 TRINITY_DN323_c0_g1~~TRINITY_DN323_c0_g1_i3.p1  ORF type:complete len:400 (-),score=84.54 TRINITY_DN323_c0_g1_i3:238-1437(-)